MSYGNKIYVTTRKPTHLSISLGNSWSLRPLTSQLTRRSGMRYKQFKTMQARLLPP